MVISAGRKLNLVDAYDFNDEDSVREWLAEKLFEGQLGMTTELTLVTPMMAEVLMECNIGNRKFRNPNFQKFCDIIREGRWIICSQGVSISVEGKLNNGQHRLPAIIKTGIAVQMNLTFGEPTEAFNVIDQQKTRSAADVLIGESYGAQLAASLRLLNSIENGTPRAKLGMDNDEIVHALPDHPKLREACAPGTRTAKVLKCAATGAVVAYYVILTQSQRPYLLAEFWDKLHTGADLEKGNPILTLRTKLQKARETTRNQRQDGGYVNHDVAAFIIMAWNAWVKKNRPQVFIWKTTEFPKPL